MRVVRDVRVWLILAMILAIGAGAVVLPDDIILLEYLVAPVVASAVLGDVIISLLAMAVSLLMVAGAMQWHLYPTDHAQHVALALIAAGAVATGVAVYVRNTEAATHRARDRFRLVAEHAADVVFEADANRVITWISPNLTRVLGWKPSEVIGRAPSEFLNLDDVRRTEQLREDAYQGRVVSQPEGGTIVRVRRADGTSLWMAANITPMLGPDGTPSGIIGSLTDVEELVEARRQAEESEARYRLLLENTTDMVFLLAANGTIEWVSPSIEGTLGWKPLEVIGSRNEDLLHPEDRIATSAAMRQLAADGESGTLMARMQCKDGTYRLIESAIHPAESEDGAPARHVVRGRDIERQRAAELELERRARYDELTGVLKRSEMISHIDVIARHRRTPGNETYVLYIDVDGFKQVNDTHGHRVGDLVLTTVAERLQHGVRAGDHVARMGGDEFLVILEHLHDADAACQVAEKLRALNEVPIATSVGHVHVSLSIGVAHSVPIESADELIARADHAMYQAKRSGRNQVRLAEDPEF